MADIKSQNYIQRKEFQLCSLAQLEYSRDGYDFVRWQGENELTCSDAMSVTFDNKETHISAVWNPINYQIIYQLDGGTNNPSNPSSYNIETETIILSDATKEGYIFNKWTDSAGNQITQISKGSFGDLTLSAHYFKSKNWLIYDNNYEDRNFILKTNNNEYKFNATDSSINRKLQYCSSSYPYKPTTPYSDITELQDKNNLIEVNDENGDISSIGYRAFSDCSSITSINCPNVTTIQPYAFSGNQMSAMCFQKINSLMSSSFENMINLEKLDFRDATITTFGEDSLHIDYYYNNINTIILSNMTNVPMLHHNAFNTYFPLYTEQIKVYIPFGKISEFQSVGWNTPFIKLIEVS